MSIETVGIIGLGALGTLYAGLFTDRIGRERTLVLADAARTERYRREGVWLNGVLRDFQYTDAAARTEPVDLLLFAVKFGGLESAIASCQHLVGDQTIVLSVLNGISSEEVLETAFGTDRVVWCVAQKMSAKKEGNRAVCGPMGELAVGVPADRDDRELRRLTAFFDEIGFPYAVPSDIRTHMWSKLMCNTGCNQAMMVFQCGYGGLQAPGDARDTMIRAMREVVTVAHAEGIPLSESEIGDWVAIIDRFQPDGETSMRQDAKAHRKSEVALFSGTICRLAQKHGLAVPVNDWLYQKIQEMEATYSV